MECVEMNALSCLEPYRETIDDFNCTDRKVQCVAKSFNLQPAFTQTRPVNLARKTHTNPVSHFKMKPMGLGDDLLAAGGALILKYDHDFAGDKDDRFSIVGKFYDDKYSLEGKISQAFNQEGLGKLESEIAFNYNDEDKRTDDNRTEEPIRENH